MTEKNILGRPITGDISNYSYFKPVPQKGPEEFLQMFDEFFEQHPECTFIRWAQGTPGFNDGEPCTFDIHETRFGFTDPDEELDDDEHRDYGDNTLTSSNLATFVWENPGTYRGGYHYEYNKTFNGVLFTEELVEQYKNFGVGDEFRDLVNEKFGDPAEVTATRDGFHVEYYEIGY